MAIPTNMSRFVISGSLPGGDEFATSFWSDQNCPTTQAQATAAAINVRSTFETDMLPTLKGFWGIDCVAEKVTVYAYPTGGPLSSFIGESSIASGAGTATGKDLPVQCALVVTLLTGLPGRRRRGRMYWPLNQATLVTNQLSLAQITSIVEAQESWFNDLQTLTTAFAPVVLSQVGAGSTAPVTALRADTIVDIQRRRSDKVEAVASYQQAV